MNESDRIWRESGLQSAVLAGDERAWQTLYDESYEALAAYAAWRCAGLRDLSEEVVQETWLTAVRRIRSFDPKRGSFSGWLKGIAANVLRNHLRARVYSPESLGNGQCSNVAAPDAALLKRERAERMCRALAAISEQHEAVLRAKYLEQRRVAEIADAWKQTSKAIESLLTRARQALREAYQMLENDHE